jgi:hypothetical protein
MPKYKPLTAKEEGAVLALKHIAKSWPKNLWLFSASGTLCVMKRNSKREMAERPGYGGYDPAYKVADIKIPNDGGDW